MDIGTLTGRIELQDQLSEGLIKAAEHVTEFADHFKGMAGVVVAGSAVIVGAIAGATTSIVSFGMEGSKLLDIEHSFDRLAESAGTTGQALREAFSEGFQGTVDSTEAMQKSSRLLASGLKLTADQARLLAATSRELGKATGQDAASGLQVLTTALTTGQTRLLRQQGILADTRGAEEAYARSLGTTADQLTAAGKLTADRIAIFKALQERLDQTGVSELSFADRVQQTKVAFHDWVDELRKSIAASPDVIAAFDAIKNAILDAFGGNSEALRERIIDWVNRFARAVKQYGPGIIDNIANVARSIVTIYEAVLKVWNLVPEWLQRVAKYSLEAAVAVGVLSGAFQLLTGETIVAGAVKLSEKLSAIAVASEAVEGGLATVISDALLLKWAKFVGVFTAISDGFVALGGILVGVGEIFTGTILGPIIGVTAAVAALAVGVRYLTGSWDFILTPLKFAYQTLSDIGTIVSHVVTDAIKEEKVYLDLLIKSFRTFADDIRTYISPQMLIIGGFFKELLKDIKEFDPILGRVVKSLQLLHVIAESERVADAAAAAQAQRDRQLASRFQLGPTGGPQVQAKGFTFPTIPQLGLPNLKPEVPELPQIKPPAVVDPYGKFVESLQTLDQEITVAQKHHMDLNDQVRLFGSAATKAAQDAQAWGVKVTKNVKTVADAFDDIDAKAAADEVRKAVMKMSDDIEKSAEQGVKDWDEGMQSIADGVYGTARKIEDTLANIDYAEGVQNAKNAIAGVAAQIDEIGVKSANSLKNRLADTFKSIPDTLIAAFEGGGDLSGAFKSIGTQLGKDLLESLEATIKKQIASGGSVLSGSTAKSSLLGGLLAGGVAASSGASTGRQLAGVATAGAQVAGTAATLGASLGSSLALGAITFGAGAAVVGLVALIKHLNAARNAVKDFAKQFGSFDELHKQLLQLGDAGEQLWIKLTQQSRSKSAVLATEQEIQNALAAFNEDLDKYNLSLDELATTQDQVKRSADALEGSYKRLTGAGFSADRVIGAMAGDLNNWLSAALKAGTKIPAAMQPILEQLIRTHQITEANAKALLGMATDSIPSLDEISAAADRYGIKLDELGPKVQQLQINELADQYVADWKTLTSATDDWGVLFDKMGPKVQDLINRALKYGVELPSSMKPMVQAFIDAGRLVDDNGKKLTDISQLPWSLDLSQAVDDLIGKLDELIDTIKGGVGGALDNLGKKVVRPRVEVQVDGMPNPDDLDTGTNTDRATPRAAMGGIVMPHAGGTQVTVAEAGQAEAIIPLQNLDHYITTGQQALVASVNDLAKKTIDTQTNTAVASETAILTSIRQLADQMIAMQTSTATGLQAVLESVRQLASNTTAMQGQYEGQGAAVGAAPSTRAAEPGLASVPAGPTGQPTVANFYLGKQMMARALVTTMPGVVNDFKLNGSRS